MLNNKKHLLLICHSFPPYAGIGGRRWAKFAKYLVRKGYVVHVVCAPNPDQPESLWTSDIQHPDIIRYPVADRYIHLKPQKSILGKIKNRLARYMMYLLTRGTIYDLGIFWKTPMLIQVKKLLNTYPISHIIATGAPFKPFYYLTALRSDFPEVKILLDYRDPWTNAINYGMSSLSRGRLQYELDIEKKAIQNADVIMSPTDPFIQIPEAIKSALPKTKIVELPHAYDQDDLPAIQAQAPQDNIIRIIYTGTLYEGLKPLLTAWADALLNLQQQDSQLYERIRIDFYTNETKTGLDFKEKHPEIISLNKTVPVKEMYQKISEASICLLFSLPHIRHYKTTKFFEYLTLSKPFLLLGDKGNVSQFLDDEKIGQSLDIQDLQNGLLNSTIYTILDPRHIQTKYDHSRFSFDYVTDQLITLLT